MLRSPLRRFVPSPALFVALLALIVALGGTSYAAMVLARNSVRSQHIVNGQVKTVDLGDNAVTSLKVRDGSLRSSDFASGQLPPGSVDTVTVVAWGFIGAGSFDSVTAWCPAGMEAIGGGTDSTARATTTTIASFPVINDTDLIDLNQDQYPAATGWRAVGNNVGTAQARFSVAVVCAQ